MIPIASLWLAILLAAVLVFIASAVVWMVLPHHKRDFKKFPNEDVARDALQPQDMPPGQYNIPHVADPSEVKNPDMVKKFEGGPVGFFTVLPNGLPSMGKSLVRSFVFYLLVSACVAYVATRAVPPGTEYMRVFQITGTIAWMAYGFAVVQDAIWFGKPWSSVWKNLFDAFIYGCLTAGAFSWQWQVV